MNTLLIHQATCVATFDDTRTELKDASVLVRGHRIEWMGAADDLPPALRDAAGLKG